METRTWKRIGAGLAVAALVTTGYLLWQDRRETAAKAVLSAEIRAARAARPRLPEPVPTAEELETADQYRVAASGMTVTAFLCGEFEGASEAMDRVPWAAVPEAIASMLAANAEPLALADAAAARGACRFADTSLQTKVSTCTMLLRLLSARGHAALATGDPLAAAGEVQRLLRVGRDLAAAPAQGDEERVLPWPYWHLRTAEQHAAGLLSALATAPNLPPEAGPALAAAARAPWGSAEANRLCIDFLEDSDDANSLRLLGPDAQAFLDKMNAGVSEMEDLLRVTSANPGFLEKAGERVRAVLRPGIPVPPAASIRWLRDLRVPVVAAARLRDYPVLAPDGPHEKFGALLGFLCPRWIRHTLAEEGRIAVARAAAAIRAFDLKVGRPPGTIEELVPTVLSEVPLDPFDGKPLHYEIDDNGWRVASRVWRDSFGKGEGEDGAVEADPPAEVRFPRRAK